MAKANRPKTSLSSNQSRWDLPWKEKTRRRRRRRRRRKKRTSDYNPIRDDQSSISPSFCYFLRRNDRITCRWIDRDDFLLTQGTNRIASRCCSQLGSASTSWRVVLFIVHGRSCVCVCVFETKEEDLINVHHACHWMRTIIIIFSLRMLIIRLNRSLAMHYDRDFFMRNECAFGTNSIEY